MTVFSPHLKTAKDAKQDAAPQRVCILGSTGSIGVNTLDVIARHPGRFEVFALSAYQRIDDLYTQCVHWRPRFAAVPDADVARALQHKLRAQNVSTIVLSGAQALCELAAHDQTDVVMAAIVGAAGLAPCMAAAHSGKRLLLANKEALVVGGALFMQAVEQGQATLLPIDSEHSAIFQCLPLDASAWAAGIDHILLTSSGGPFRQCDPATLADVTPEMACAHPNFVMGRKISVDSATMMNKALEVIEARWLFNLAPSQIRVLIHPQQIVHSMVVLQDSSVLAQLGTPDMRVPIAYGLSHPARMASGAAALNFAQLGSLTFEAPDHQRFTCLALAWAALAAVPGTTAVLNAANEVAVAAFLERQIRFDQIYAVIAQTMESVAPSANDVSSLEALLALDARARSAAAQCIQQSRQVHPVRHMGDAGGFCASPVMPTKQAAAT
jgi:1-deoxy-D-xylulose-5-phosphate reductoisomerase